MYVELICPICEDIIQFEYGDHDETVRTCETCGFDSMRGDCKEPSEEYMQERELYQ